MLFKEGIICYTVFVSRAFCDHFRTGGIYDMADENKKEEYSKRDIDTVGEVKIADEAVAMIAGIAACETDGVDSMADNISRNIANKLGVSAVSKGVRIDITDNSAVIDLNIVIKYGYNIPEVTSGVQEKVRDAVESMTGLSVTGVNIHVADIKIDSEE